MEGETEEAPVAENEVEQDPAPAPETSAPEERKPHGNAGQQPWYMKRLAEEANKQREANDRAAAAERRAAEAEAIAARLRTNPQEKQDPPQPPQPRQEDRRAEISAEAARQRFYEDTGEVRSRGVAAYGAAFSETLNILSALGATNDDFIGDVLAIDKAGAHDMLKRISEDPEKAVALTQMSSRQRIAELTRMHLAAGSKTETTTEAKPAPAAPANKSSKAPAPAPHVTPSAAKVKDWRSDDASDEEFDAGFRDMMAKRNARR